MLNAADSLTQRMKNSPPDETAVQCECGSNRRLRRSHTWKGHPTHHLASHWDKVSICIPNKSRHTCMYHTPYCTNTAQLSVKISSLWASYVVAVVVVVVVVVVVCRWKVMGLTPGCSSIT